MWKSTQAIPSKNYPVYYSIMLSSACLERVEGKAQQELNKLVLLLAEKQGVTEKLKGENQLQWIGMMNNIKAQAEEIIYSEIVYVRGA